MQRIQFADNTNGDGLYTLPYNPVEADVDDNDRVIVSNNLASRPVHYVLQYDDRPVVLRWKGWKFDNATFSGMVQELKSYVYENKYVRWGTISDMFVNNYAGTGWQGPFFVASVTPKIKDGGGKICDEVEIVMYLSE